MKNYFSILLLIFLPVLLNAQTGAKYLAGAVPELDGKVIFTKTINVKEHITSDKLFELMNNWATNFTERDDKLSSRLLMVNPDTKTIACGIEEYLVFNSSAFSMDRAKMTYQLIIEIKDNACDVTVRNIKYDYSDSKDLLLAEETITDKYALNKNADKLNRYYDKFRIHTIDSINSLFNSIDVYLNGVNTSVEGAVAKTNLQVEESRKEKIVDVPVLENEVQPVTQTIISNVSKNEYQSVGLDKISKNILEILKDETLIVSQGIEGLNLVSTSATGIGYFEDKPVVYSMVSDADKANMGDTYTLSFYKKLRRDILSSAGATLTSDKMKDMGLVLIKTPSGVSVPEDAWLVIECKKLSESNIDNRIINIGEILNVWMK